MALACPERSYLLTLAGRDWQTVRMRVGRWRYRIRQVAPGWQDCWHVEPNPSGSGEHHVHGLAWGPYLPIETARRAAEREGLGSWLGLRRIRGLQSAAMYGVKLAALAASAYSVKGVDDLELFLEANGGRMVHASRGFWRDGGGASLPGVGVARRVAGQRVAEGHDLCPVTGERHSWDVVRVPWETL